MNLNTKVSDNIKKFRKKLNWSQLYIATKMGMSQNNFSRIESGQSKITCDQIEKICNIMEIEFIKLLT